MYIWKKVYNNVMKMIISRAQHYPHTYNFACPTANKMNLPLVTKLIEEDQLWKILLLAVKTLPYASCVASVVL